MQLRELYGGMKVEDNVISIVPYSLPRVFSLCLNTIVQTKSSMWRLTSFEDVEAYVGGPSVGIADKGL